MRVSRSAEFVVVVVVVAGDDVDVEACPTSPSEAESGPVAGNVPPNFPSPASPVKMRTSNPLALLGTSFSLASFCACLRACARVNVGAGWEVGPEVVGLILMFGSLAFGLESDGAEVDGRGRACSRKDGWDNREVRPSFDIVDVGVDG